MKNAVILLNIITLFIFAALLAKLTSKDKSKDIVKTTIKGSVKNTGVYYIREETKFSDLLELIGGYKDNVSEIDNFIITNDSSITVDTKYKLR